MRQWAALRFFMDANVTERPVPFTLDGRTYDLKLTFWVEAEICQRFGGVLEAMKGSDMLKNLLTILTLLINEAVDIHNDASREDPWDHLDERYVGRHLSHRDTKTIADTVSQVLQMSRPTVDEAALTDEEKNGSPSR